MGFIDNPQSGANMGKCQNLLRLYSNFALFVRIGIELDGYPHHPYNFDMADGDIIKFSFSHQNKKKPKQPL